MTATATDHRSLITGAVAAALPTSRPGVPARGSEAVRGVFLRPAMAGRSDASPEAHFVLVPV